MCTITETSRNAKATTCLASEEVGDGGLHPAGEGRQVIGEAATREVSCHLWKGRRRGRKGEGACKFRIEV